ncbi:TetR family transcriptional regulator [Micromonospora sp. BRA006-A]|nr:TetR family transcriptional regulator [Micromonospora sp. BRA006-A]
MPKIQASTVAEHRAAQRAALLDAARALLSEHPEQIPSLADVARHAGLARSSAYSYFKSRTDMFDVLVADTFPGGRPSSRSGWPRPARRARIPAYVEANLQLVARGDHAWPGHWRRRATARCWRPPAGCCTTASRRRCAPRSPNTGRATRTGWRSSSSRSSMP